MTLITGDPTVADIRVLAPLVYVIPTYVLYGILLKIIFFSPNMKNFKSSFYIVFGVYGVNNIVYSVSYYIFYKVTNAPIFLPLLALLPEEHFLLTLVPWIMFHAMYTENFLNLVMSFNRFTVIYMKTHYKTFWRKHLLWIIIVACSIGNVFNWQIFATDVRIRIINASAPELGYRWDMYNQNILPSWWRNASNIGLVTIITASLSLLFNCYASYKILKQKFLKLSNNTTVSKQDIQLFVFNVLIFLNQVGNFIIQVMFMYVTNSEQRIDMFRTQFWVVDINTLTPAWFLCLMSENIRREVFKIIFCSSFKFKQEATTSSTTENKQIFRIIKPQMNSFNQHQRTQITLK